MRQFIRQRGSVQGFTLIELMIVVIIIAILAAFALPAYTNYILKSKIRTAQSDLLALSLNAENYRQRTLAYYSVDADKTTSPTIEAVFTGWYPAQGADFKYTYDWDSPSTGKYTVKATGLAGKLSSCVVSLDSDNLRKNTSCPAVGTTW